MVAKSELKLIKSLHQKKYRNKHRLFFVEGLKSVTEFLASDYPLVHIFKTKEVTFSQNGIDVVTIDEADLKKISVQASPNGILAVFKMKEPSVISFKDWVLALDDVRDPGNLGTIIRLCDWFGIENLLCSKATVDCYNPKVLQASMGSFTRVNIVYDDLKHFLTTSKLPIFGTFMNGDNVYQAQLPSKGILLMGNEANGIHEKWEALIHNKLAIPQYGAKATESLNVATATAIFLSEIRRG